jgi:hypothetical protein
MNVLDPFEVCEIAVYPLPEYQKVNSKHGDYKAAKMHLDALEYKVHQEAAALSEFGILNEKDPTPQELPVPAPTPLRGCIVSEDVRKLRSHPDVRIARRAHTISKLAQVISERDIQKHGGLRRVMLVQSRRLESLARNRYKSLGEAALVERGPEQDAEESASNDEAHTEV